MAEFALLPSPVGLLKIDADGGSVIRVSFADEESPPDTPPREILDRALRELREYFSCERREFELPLRRPEATPFQHRVWDALLRIPFGQTLTYGELARELGTSPRAVGGACARNALPILIPCHRVVAKTGLGGFSGDWETGLALRVKAELLRHETAVLGGSRV
ncbi:MAG: methylated-DNA--[protein]-cysteine S-methyltransferase [Deltaproteobacteria bacterium]|nr:methylated-DNA--[protein]-cysteine S-methyltransferase [Deltaproteobacteria bacterium]